MRKGTTGYAQRMSTEICAIQGLPGGTPIDDGPYVMLLDLTTSPAARPNFIHRITLVTVISATTTLLHAIPEPTLTHTEINTTQR